MVKGQKVTPDESSESPRSSDEDSGAGSSSSDDGSSSSEAESDEDDPKSKIEAGASSKVDDDAPPPRGPGADTLDSSIDVSLSGVVAPPLDNDIESQVNDPELQFSSEPGGGASLELAPVVIGMKNQRATGWHPDHPKAKAEAAERLRAIKAEKVRQTELMGGQRVKFLYDLWRSHQDLKYAYINQEKYMKADAMKRKLRNTRFAIVRECERVLEKKNLNRNLRALLDRREKKLRPSEWCGRLSIICHEGDEVRGRDKRTNCYMRLRLGDHHPSERTKRTRTVKNATASPDFANEQVHFDITDGNFICEDSDVSLVVDLYDDNTFVDDHLGSVKIKCRKFIENPNKPFTQFHIMHAYKLGKGYTKTASVKLTISYERALPGIALFTLIDGRNLADRGSALDEQDPYVVLKLGSVTVRSRTIDDGGTNPSFNREELLLQVTQKSFKDNVKVSVVDENIGVDSIIGKCEFSMLRYMQNPKGMKHAPSNANAGAFFTPERKGSTNKSTREGSPATNRENGSQGGDVPLESFTLMLANKICGQLRMSVQFLPAGSLTVEVVKGRNLRNADRWGIPDPYIVLAIDSLVPTMRQEYRTPTHTDGGESPMWNCIFNFDIVDQIELSIRAWDDDFGLDTLIGYGTFSLLPLLRQGDGATSDEWVQIFFKDRGVMRPAGEVLLRMTFACLQKVKYPQYRRVEAAGEEKVEEARVVSKPSLHLHQLQSLPKRINLSVLREGFFRVTIDRAENITHPDGRSMTEWPWIFAFAILGSSGKRPVTCKTESATNVACVKYFTECSPIFHRQTLSFELSAEKMKGYLDLEGNLDLTLELWEEFMPIFPQMCGCNRLLGRVTINVNGVLSNPFTPVEDWVTFTEVSPKGGKILISMTYEQARRGMFVATLIEAKNLIDRSARSIAGKVASDMQDPYVLLDYGGDTYRSKTCNDGGVSPSFFNEKIYFWSGHDQWRKPLKISVYDDNVGKDTFIAGASIETLQFFNVERADSNKLRTISLTDRTEDSGELIFRLDFIPAGELTILCKSGRNLRNVDALGKQDPYVVFELDSKAGAAGRQKKRSKTHNDGGADPVFNEVLTFDVVDQFEISIKCYDSDFAKDTLIGETTYSLLNVFRDGLCSVAIPLSYGSSADDRKPAGELICTLHFDPDPAPGSPTGWHYPALATDVEAFLPPIVDKVVSSIGAVPPMKSWATPGRLMLTCSELKGVTGEGSSLSVYVAVGLGAESKKKQKTKTQKAELNNADVKFFDETLYFNVVDPNEIKHDEDITMCLEVYDDKFTDKLLGHVTISVQPFMSAPFTEHDEWFDLESVVSEGNNGKIRILSRFEPASIGLIKVTLSSVTNIRAESAFNTMDPYLVVSLGPNNKVTSATMKDISAKADFHDEELLIWVDHSNWTEPLNFKLFDANFAIDTILGQCDVGVTSLMGGETLPFLSINVTIPFSHVKLQDFGAAELRCVQQALSELLGISEDEIVYMKEKARVDEGGGTTGVDISFSLRKQLKKGMSSDTQNDLLQCVGELWGEVKTKSDSPARPFLQQLRSIVDGKQGGIAESLIGKIQIIGAKKKLLNLSSVRIPPNTYTDPIIETTATTGYSLRSKKGVHNKDDPEANMRIEFFPAGFLVINVIEGKSMRHTEWFGKNDPYVKIVMKGALNEVEKVGKVVEEGGSDCNLDSEFIFDVVDQKEFELSVWDKDKFGSDLIGSCKVCLQHVYRHGFVDMWCELHYKEPAGYFAKKDKEPITAGQVHLLMTFFGGRDGLAYPVHVGPESERVEAFDERERVNHVRGRVDVSNADFFVEPIADAVVKMTPGGTLIEIEEYNSSDSVVVDKGGQLFTFDGAAGVESLSVDTADNDVESEFEEEEEARQEVIKMMEMELAKERRILISAPPSLEFDKMNILLTEVQTEKPSKLEQHEQTLRELFAAWHPLINRVYTLNSLVDDAKTVSAYKAFKRERNDVFKEVLKGKKFYLKKMKQLKQAAIKSEDFSIVYLADREVRWTRERNQGRHYRTRREHVIYLSTRFVKLFLQYIFSAIYATIVYLPFLFLFCFGFVCSKDVDVNDGEWHGEDLEAAASGGCFLLFCTVGYPGYILDIRSHFFGREGEKRHFLWRKVFRPRNFDEKVLQRLVVHQAAKDKEDEERDDKVTFAKSFEDLKLDAKGGIEKVAQNVQSRKDESTSTSRKAAFGDLKGDEDSEDDEGS